MPFHLHVGHVADDLLAIYEAEAGAEELHGEHGVIPCPLRTAECKPDCKVPLDDWNEAWQGICDKAFQTQLDQHID